MRWTAPLLIGLCCSAAPSLPQDVKTGREVLALFGLGDPRVGRERARTRRRRADRGKGPTADPIAIANFRTKLEAEVAATPLKAAGIPYLIQSAEGMLHGPLPPGATLYVAAEVARTARRVLRHAGVLPSRKP